MQKSRVNFLTRWYKIARVCVPVVQGLLQRRRNVNFLKKGTVKLLISILLLSVTHDDQISGCGVPGWGVTNPGQILTRPTLPAFGINPVTDMYDVKIFRDVREHRCGSVWQGFFVSRFKSHQHQQQQQKSPPQLCSRVRGSNFQGSPFSKLSANY